MPRFVVAWFLAPSEVRGFNRGSTLLCTASTITLPTLLALAHKDMRIDWSRFNGKDRGSEHHDADPYPRVAYASAIAFESL